MSKENGFVDVSTIEKCQELIAHQVVKISELEEQLKNSIVAKFKIGQKCYIRIDKEIEYAKIEKIIITIGKYDEECSVYYSITDSYGYALRLPQEQLFTTKEEAQAKLEELKGE